MWLLSTICSLKLIGMLIYHCRYIYIAEQFHVSECDGIRVHIRTWRTSHTHSIAYGKITMQNLEDKLVRFLVQESQSQSSSHDFLLFDTQYLPRISTFSSYLSSNLRPATTHKSNWQHQNMVRQIQNLDLGKCKIAIHCAVWPGWDRDSGNLYPIYPLFPCSDFLSQMGGGGGGCNVFLALYAISNILFLEKLFFFI